MTPPFRFNAFVLTLLCAIAAIASGCEAERAISIPERVLLVVTDATHSAHLSCYGDETALTPSIDELANTGVRFSRAFSNNTWTLASTASLLTGQLQEHHGAVTNHHRLDERAVTTAEHFKSAGFTTAAFVQMAYASAKFGFDQGFDTFRYYGKGQPGRAGQTVPQTVEWLDEHADENWFLYLHMRRPHSPYKPNPQALARLDANCPLAGGERNEEFEFADTFGPREIPEAERLHVEHLYEANLETTDALLAQVFNRAVAQGAMIVVTSDHGEALGQHGVFGHGVNLWAEAIDIPLIFWWPGATGRIDEQPASSIDVLPTLLEVCDLPLGSRLQVDGGSLVDRLVGVPTVISEPVIASGRYSLEQLPKIAVIEGDWKLIWDPNGSVELFDRRADARDSNERSQSEAVRTERLTQLAADWHSRYQNVAAGGTKHDGLDAALSEDLGALGYGE